MSVNSKKRNLFFWILIAIALFGALFGLFQVLPGASSHAPTPPLAFSDFLDSLSSGKVEEVLIQGNHIRGKTKDGQAFATYAPNTPSLIGKLTNEGVRIKVEPPKEELPSLFHIFLSWLPILLLVTFSFFCFRQLQLINKKVRSKKDRTIMKRMLRKGYSLKDISEIMDVSLEDVRYLSKEIGLKEGEGV